MIARSNFFSAIRARAFAAVSVHWVAAPFSENDSSRVLKISFSGLTRSIWLIWFSPLILWCFRFIAVDIRQCEIKGAYCKFGAVEMVFRKGSQKTDHLFGGDFPCCFNGFSHGLLCNRIAAGSGVHTTVNIERDGLNDIVLADQKKFSRISALARSFSVSVRPCNSFNSVSAQGHFNILQ